MNKVDALDSLSALAQDLRLDAFRLLVAAGPEGLGAGEIAQRLGVAGSTCSSALGVLLAAGLVRNAREGRAIRYFAEGARLGALIDFLSDGAALPAPPTTAPYNVLFLCTGNSARSLIAEAILHREGAGRFRAFSAGSHPGAAPHPYALDLLRGLHHDIAFARSKSWDEFGLPGAPKMQFVFTVCDQAAAEACPVWPGQPMSAHWGVPDPVAATGTEAERRLAFTEAYRMLRNRITTFIALPLASLDRLALKTRVDEIGADIGVAEAP